MTILAAYSLCQSRRVARHQISQLGISIPNDNITTIGYRDAPSQNDYNMSSIAFAASLTPNGTLLLFLSNSA